MGYPVHFLQIWIVPDRQNYPPSYEQKSFSVEDKRGRFCLMASRTGRNDSVSLHQDVEMYVSLLDGVDSVAFDLQPGRCAWIQIARGEVDVNSQPLHEGDGLAIDEPGQLRFHNAKAAEMVLFDMRHS